MKTYVHTKTYTQTVQTCSSYPKPEINQPSIHSRQDWCTPTVPLDKEDKGAPKRWLRTHLCPCGHGSCVAVTSGQGVCRAQSDVVLSLHGNWIHVGWRKTGQVEDTRGRGCLWRQTRWAPCSLAWEQGTNHLRGAGPGATRAYRILAKRQLRHLT